MSDSCNNSHPNGSKSLVVLNGQYYAGENKEDNRLIFHQERAKAVVIDARRLRFIIQSIYYWIRSGEVELQRLEILKAGGEKHV